MQNMIENPMPKDVSAYMEKACLDEMEAQQFNPQSQRDFECWLEGNFNRVCIRAQEAMAHLMQRLFDSPAIMENVRTVLGNDTYHAIRARNSNPVKRWNARFIAYAAESGLTPEQALERDGNMTGFLCWHPKSKTGEGFQAYCDAI